MISAATLATMKMIGIAMGVDFLSGTGVYHFWNWRTGKKEIRIKYKTPKGR